MKLVIIHMNSPSVRSADNGLLRFGVSNEPIASIILDGLSRNLQVNGDTDVLVAIPKRWGVEFCRTSPKIEHYDGDISFSYEYIRLMKRKPWCVVSNGRFATRINNKLLDKVLTCIQADIVAVNVEPDLLAYSEKIRLTARDKVAGFRRLYSDSAEPVPIPVDWPHHIFVKTKVLDQVLVGRILPGEFSNFVERCRSNSLRLRAINMGGTAVDLEAEDGMLSFCGTELGFLPLPRSCGKIKTGCGIAVEGNNNRISQDSKFVGKVLLGKNVQVSPKAVIMGPTIIADNVTIEQGAVINSSVIGPEVCVPPNRLVQNRVIKGPRCNWRHQTQLTTNNSTQIRYSRFDLDSQQRTSKTFRSWPRFSYAGCFKRIADCCAAVIVLILFAPIIPFIALAIRISSPGPVFFKDKRQGLHGKLFNCLKFRTMLLGADKIQDKLRGISQVDGPQFKMENDPRLNAVGRFLRETCIDEIPQFLNVLLGQMSVVGPRPSPKSENTLCPPWRDARLSVRPGITGLWQVSRTRQPMKDFQEWIYYDTKYVRNLSLKLDLWICWKTAGKMVENFVSQFSK